MLEWAPNVQQQQLTAGTYMRKITTPVGLLAYILTAAAAAAAVDVMNAV